MPDAFQIRTELADIVPTIWRRFVVPSSLTLTELHAVIQGAMGWQDSHLHMFEIDGQSYEIPEDDELGPEPGYLDERRHRLIDLLSVGLGFSYKYDFGDGWRHTVVVEDALTLQPWEAHPTMIAGERACPPEDCGGPYRYADFLEALTDPKHPEHESTAKWAGPFQPDVFSVSQAESLMHALCALYRERGMGFGV